MQVNFNITSALEKSFGAAAAAYKREVTIWLASEYGFDANEALSKIGGDVIKSQGKKPKKPNSEEEKKPKAKCVLPYRYLGECYCQALRLDHCLYTQCSNKHLDSGEYCKTCQKTVDTNGSAPYGTVSNRGPRGSYIDPSGKKEKSYGTVLKQRGIDLDLAKSEVAKFEIDVADEEWEVKVGKRGRPKGVAVSDTESSNGTSKETKKRGRPKKAVVENGGEDLIAALARQAMETSDHEEEPYIGFDEGIINTGEKCKITATPVNSELVEEVVATPVNSELVEEVVATPVNSELVEEVSIVSPNAQPVETNKPKQRKKRINGTNYVVTSENQVYYGKGHENAGVHCGEWDEQSKSIAFVNDDDEDSTSDEASSEN
jgi:hypothetical protein